MSPPRATAVRTSEGYWLTVKNIVSSLARDTAGHSRINIIYPAIIAAMCGKSSGCSIRWGLNIPFFPDYADTLDAPYNNPYQKIPDGVPGLKISKKWPALPATDRTGDYRGKQPVLPANT
jgi:nitrogenase molybdenum-iron protein NifN